MQTVSDGSTSPIATVLPVNLDRTGRWRIRRSVTLGAAAGLLLLGFYLLVVGLMSRSVAVGLRDLGRWWYWFLPLSIGFGTQVGLLAYLRLTSIARPSGPVAASTATSSGAMLACCLHHVTDLAPFVGLAAASTFVSRFREPLFALAILVNVVAVWLMVRRVRAVSNRTG